MLVFYCNQYAGAFWRCFNTLRPRQNGRHFADDIFKCIFLNENVWIPLKTSLAFVPKGPINNIPTLVQVMATSHYLNQWWLIYRRIFASLGLNELMILNTFICTKSVNWSAKCWKISRGVSLALQLATTFIVYSDCTINMAFAQVSMLAFTTIKKLSWNISVSKHHDSAYI